jgi:hypothetical protein
VKQSIGLFGFKIAREEFPNYDVTVRGSVSLGGFNTLWQD